MSKERTRKRSLPQQMGGGRLVSKARPYPNGVYGPSTTQTMTYFAKPGTEITTSEGHPFHSRQKGDLRDLGGNFYNKKSYFLPPGKPKGMAITVIRNGFERYNQFSGHIFPVSPNQIVFPPSIESSAAQLDVLGATAVARCKPTNSVADAATFLGELYKEGLPHLAGSSTWKSRNSVAKDAADDFLNVQFGWLPLVNEVTNFGDAVSRASTVLKQYERDAGKVVRRRYNFPDQRSVTTSDMFPSDRVAFYGPSASDFETNDTPRGRVLLTRETVKRQWFSGAFTYALPSGYDSRSALDRYALYADKMLGASLTPDTLWELAPWSWAVDWFSNTGDVVSNISAWMTDGLVMHYGYMMEESIVKDTYSMGYTGLKNNTVTASPITAITHVKQRRRANPFGFGLTWDGLSPIQKAIAAAIGISRWS